MIIHKEKKMTKIKREYKLRIKRKIKVAKSTKELLSENYCRFLKTCTTLALSLN